MEASQYHQLVITELMPVSKYTPVLSYHVECPYQLEPPAEGFPPCASWEQCPCCEDYDQARTEWELAHNDDLDIDDWINGRVGLSPHVLVPPHPLCPSTSLVHHSWEGEIMTATGPCYVELATIENADIARVLAFHLEPGSYPITWDADEDGIRLELVSAPDAKPDAEPEPEREQHVAAGWEIYGHGHGHVTPRGDGYQAPCGGLFAGCLVCAGEQALKAQDIAVRAETARRALPS